MDSQGGKNFHAAWPFCIEKAKKAWKFTFLKTLLIYIKTKMFVYSITNLWDERKAGSGILVQNEFLSNFQFESNS